MQIICNNGLTMTPREAYKAQARLARRGDKFNAIEKSINRNIAKLHKPIAKLVSKLRSQVRREVEAALMARRNAENVLMYD